MKRSVQFTLESRLDLKHIGIYIARDNLMAALQFVDILKNCCTNTIGENPEIGRQREDVAAGLRIFPCRDYLVLYRIKPDFVEIIRVVHGSRDVESLGK